MAHPIQNTESACHGPMPLSEKLGIGFWLSVGWIALVFACAIFADLLPLAEYDAMDWKNQASPPGFRAIRSDSHGQSAITTVYVFGTDTMGRDILARLIYGARISLAVGLIAPMIGLVIGGIIGMLAGFYRGRAETIVMAIMDVILAFPGLVLLLAVYFYLGPGLDKMIFALGFLTIPAFTRVARANTLNFSQRDFVTAARALGQSDIHILAREILPNIVMPMIVYALLIVSYMIVAEGSLSFLALGVPPPTPSWGGMIAGGKEMLDEAAHVSLIPALVMFLTVLSFNLIGDAVRALVDAREGQL
ncbi:MAG: hypothetical protein VR64_00230 [Desulfatitalea sp. BRH_c12]|nr:MAG: hypothetical protein VR64_00230 [Desulfatitalea sp. BRH_c12]